MIKDIFGCDFKYDRNWSQTRLKKKKKNQYHMHNWGQHELILLYNQEQITQHFILNRYKILD